MSLADDLVAAAAEAMYAHGIAECGPRSPYHVAIYRVEDWEPEARAAVAAILRRLSGLRGHGLNNLRTANLAVLASAVERDGDTT